MIVLAAVLIVLVAILAGYSYVLTKKLEQKEKELAEHWIHDHLNAVPPPDPQLLECLELARAAIKTAMLKGDLLSEVERAISGITVDDLQIPRRSGGETVFANPPRPGEVGMNEEVGPPEMPKISPSHGRTWIAIRGVLGYTAATVLWYPMTAPDDNYVVLCFRGVLRGGLGRWDG